MNAQRHLASPVDEPVAAVANGVRFGILGPLEARICGEQVDLGPPKQRALLAVLISHANETVSRERLIDALWPEAPPTNARHSVHVYISRLRRAFGEHAASIETRLGGYQLQIDDGALDLDRFRAMVDEGRAALARDPVRSAELLGDALALWRGAPMAGLERENATRELRAGLDELRLTTVEVKIEAELAAARHEELVPELERRVASHPLRERLRAQLILALYRSGRQADALAAYGDLRERLRQELALEPGAELRALQQAVLRQDPSLSLHRVDALTCRPHLPAPVTSFVGRDRETKELAGLLTSGSARLVTVTGVGGIGKTRVAITAAEAAAQRFPDGTWFVDLASIRNADLVATQIADAFGIRVLPGRVVIEVVADHLRRRDVLLVIDNFEHVLAAAPVVSLLLRASRETRILVTSRSRLGLYGEYEYPLDPLEGPDGLDLGAVQRSAAGALFLERAAAAAPRLVFDDADAEALGDVVAAVDGLPLAIELAAALTRRLSVQEIRARLSPALDALTEGPRDVEDRHRTLRATVAWSEALLAAELQALFHRLGVFSGGFDLEAVRAVCAPQGEVQPGIDALVAQSLVRQDSVDPLRFSMLQTITEFACERLSGRGEADQVRTRHALHYLRLAEEADRQLTGGQQLEWLRAVDLELPNLRAALDWLICARAPEAARLALALCLYWEIRGLLGEGCTALASVIAQTRDPFTRAAMLGELGILQVAAGRFDEAEGRLDEAAAGLEAEGRSASLARVLVYRSWIHLERGESERATTVAAEAAGLALADGDERTARLANVVQANIAIIGGDLVRGQRLVRRCLIRSRAAGDLRVAAAMDSALAAIEFARGDPRAAASAAGAALTVQRELGDRIQIAVADAMLALAEAELGDTFSARRRVADVLDLFVEIGNERSIADALAALAAIVVSEGELQDGAILAGAADSLRGEIRPNIVEQALEERWLGPARERGGDIWAANWKAGSELSLDGILGHARRVAAPPA